MLSDDYADKVIVTTIQKLGLALDTDPKKGYRERLESLSDQRIVFIFDECHRSQFGDNHEAIKNFFPKAQLFGFTGTPIFEDNASYTQVDGTEGSYKVTADIFQKCLHEYTITHAIEDRNVLRFHIDYFKSEEPLPVGSDAHKQAVVKAILNKHNAATNDRRFNAVFATASINDAIHYYDLFKQAQKERAEQIEDYEPLNIACVFSPPVPPKKVGDANSERNAADIKQLVDDLPQEKEDNKKEPEKKKKALTDIITDYNTQYGTSHTLGEFDTYYQDVQQRIKFQRFTNSDYAHKNKIDVVIVVDMLLTGFDSKYLNTLYVDKNLKYHGLIQAFSRTNRILNDTKPYGNILDFRGQQTAVDQAIALFSGEQKDRGKEIWLVEPAPVMVRKFQEAVAAMGGFMHTSNLAMEPQEVYNIQGDAARIDFITRFKEVQRLKTQLDQYTDLTEEEKATIERTLPEDQLRAFRSSYLETAKLIKEKREREGDAAGAAVQQLDLELVLFASAVVDYDYIMRLISRFTHGKPSKQKVTRDQLISLLGSSANLLDEREEITAYINTLQVGKGLSKEDVEEGYNRFKAAKHAEELAGIAQTHGLAVAALQHFVDGILGRMIFDGEALTDLLAPLELGWKERSAREHSLMKDLVPLLKKQAQGREISGLTAYE
jgi:type I restriction enzyme R subunit